MKADRIVGFQHDNTNPASQIASSSSASASVSASASTATRCLVCEHPDGGSAHFGSTSCLACAAFFRRTVSLNIQFVCKKDRNCVIFHELRMICRSCRFDKCITAGMKRECVQKRRSNKKIPKKHMHGLIGTSNLNSNLNPNPNSGINFNSMNLSPNTLENAIKPFLKQEMIDIDYGNVEDGMGQMVDSPFSLKTPNSEEASPGCLSEETMAPPQILQQPKFEEVATQMPSTSSANIVTIAGILAGNFGGVVEPTNIITSIPIRPITPRSVILKQINMNGPDLLRFYVDNLNHSMDRRRMIFTETPLLAVVEDRGDVPFPSENPPPHSLKRQFQSQKFDNLLAFDFCKSCPGFDLLDRAEKAIFYRACTFSYGLLDIAWITVQAFAEEPKEPMMMYTDGSICTVNDMSYGWDDEDDIDADGKKKLFFNFVNRLHAAVCGPLRRMKMTHVEYAALKALCIWKLGYCEYTQKIRSVGKEHEEGVLIGLRNYYEDYYSEDEMCERQGNLILLMGTIFEMNQLIMETYKSAELFALFKIDTLSKELLSL